jgi:hypothetical protein
LATDFELLLRSLAAGRVDFILVGGLAANAHGSVRTTSDLDIVYSRAAANLERIAELELLRDRVPDPPPTPLPGT